MKVEIRSTRRNGINATPQELVDTPSFIGNLVIENWHQHSRFACHIRRARLLDMAILETPRDMIRPLFDPQLVRMISSLMVLHGYQIDVDLRTGEVKHHTQMWVLRPVTDE